MEELKLIVETLQGLGGEVKWVVIVWLALKAFGPLIAGGVVLTIFLLGYKLGIKALMGHQFGLQVIKLFGGEIWSSRAKTEVIRWLGKQDLPNQLDGRWTTVVQNSTGLLFYTR